jgi:hypothetical protein
MVYSGNFLHGKQDGVATKNILEPRSPPLPLLPLYQPTYSSLLEFRQPSENDFLNSDLRYVAHDIAILLLIRHLNLTFQPFPQSMGAERLPVA